MTPKSFEDAISRTRLGPRGIEATRAILLGGELPTHVAKRLGVSRIAVWKYLRVVLAAEAKGARRGITYPDYWQAITAIVPRTVAAEIRRMEMAALENIRPGWDAARRARHEAKAAAAASDQTSP